MTWTPADALLAVLKDRRVLRTEVFVDLVRVVIGLKLTPKTTDARAARQARAGQR